MTLTALPLYCKLLPQWANIRHASFNSVLFHFMAVYYSVDLIHKLEPSE